jgi:mRNA interferase MazF
MKPRRGDVVLVDFPLASQRSSKLRPALVVQNDQNNRRLHNTIVVQITSRLHPLNEPTRLLIDPATSEGQGSGLIGPSMASCENLVTVEQRMVLKVLGRLNETTMKRVDDCLRAALAL